MKKDLLRATLTGLIVAAAVLGAAIGLFCLIWGWHRLVSDLWPLDRSYVGPNLCASIFLVILVVAHNELRVVSRAEEHHESFKQAARDAIEEVAHPVESAEEAVSNAVLADMLDPKTPGGLGDIAAQLATIQTSLAKETS